MANFKKAKPKSSTPAASQVRGGLPCVILVCLIVILICVLLFMVMKYAS